MCLAPLRSALAWLCALTLVGAAACDSNGTGDPTDAAVAADATPVAADAAPPAPDAAPPGPDAWVVQSCHFDYGSEFPSPAPPAPHPPALSPSPDHAPGEVAHAEPVAPTTWRTKSAAAGLTKEPPDLTMPGYSDDMPLFSRAEAWGDTEARCYELPDAAHLLTQPEAFDLYVRIAELTTGVTMDLTPGRRNVVGLRGAYPGTFAWHGNTPNLFNDTIVLLWIDDQGGKNVREFPVNTDVGARDFGAESSSSLRPNRRYRYTNSWHSNYNALHVDESDYLVWDDTDNNGHWDSDRNGWLPGNGDGDDHERTGGGHNIHMGSVDAPLGSALVSVWSAGCQVIPGMANWTEFIYNAWTQLYDPVDYFLVDVRDIDPAVWNGPCTPDGTHACPYRITGFPYTHSADLTGITERRDDVYNCSAADEGGPEVVYLLTVDHYGTITVTVDTTHPTADPDIHLLDGNDANACMERGHMTFTDTIGPGRYFIVVDTFVEGGTELVGPYTLTVDFP